ncbi:MAG: hypothetical protein L0154_20010 [Chloroflexi bacterium]|nr:hypothetical protein [Chloroflexota bacterium]
MKAQWVAVSFEGVDQTTIKHWVARQTDGLRRNGGWFDLDMNAVNEDLAADGVTRSAERVLFQEASDELWSLLNLSQRGNNQYLMSVSFFTSITIFPVEWRMSACQTFLPDELAESVERWERFRRDVQLGHYTAYLMEWYLFWESRKAYEIWQALQYDLDALQARQEEWVDELLRTDLPYRIYMSQAPTTYPPPRWEDWQRNKISLDAAADARYEQLQRDIVSLQILRREWNSVATGFRIHFTTETFEEFLAQKDDLHLDWLFEWLHSVAARGQGLYFWG